MGAKYGASAEVVLRRLITQWNSHPHSPRLQEVQLVVQVLMGTLVERLANEEGQLVGQLARGRDTDATLPVGVHMAHPVGEDVHLVRVQS